MYLYILEIVVPHKLRPARRETARTPPIGQAILAMVTRHTLSSTSNFTTTFCFFPFWVNGTNGPELYNLRQIYPQKEIVHYEIEKRKEQKKKKKIRKDSL
ncbi:hypothetical protein TorRG33x02_016460 [Trema orientale]|uniref:Uncharacterized protein n=1 Tax=Trema orientale TaxID=63057 RepID=A0A2P5FY01_TREOI|nr:hypothetical protein TorRG33x02_016460 [Trema orientale]